MIFGALVYLSNRYDLTHFMRADFVSIEQTRYMLGRWPKSWEEVHQAVEEYNGLSLPKTFSSVRMEPLPGDSCRATYGLTNILGFPYEESEVLTWTPTREKEIAADEDHNYRAHAIARDFYRWMIQKNKGKVSTDMAPIAESVASWSDPLYSRSKITKTRLEHMPNGSPALGVFFSDGQERHVPLDDNLKDEFF